jgi:hypothetical protein
MRKPCYMIHLEIIWYAVFHKPCFSSVLFSIVNLSYIVINNKSNPPLGRSYAAVITDLTR